MNVSRRAALAAGRPDGRFAPAAIRPGGRRLPQQAAAADRAQLAGRHPRHHQPRGRQEAVRAAQAAGRGRERGGAAGILGMQSMLRAEPDGYTLIMGSSGPNAVNYALRQAALPHGGFRAGGARHHHAERAGGQRQLAGQDAGGLPRPCQDKPGGLSMAVSMIGTSGHLGGELLKNRLGIAAVTVPYGRGAATNDLLAGQVDFTVENVITVAPLVGGRLARAGRDHARAQPDPARRADAGRARLPDIDVGAWLGVLVSAKTPAVVAA